MNVIFIINDSLRKDHLGCYGNEWIQTPNIDALAKEGLQTQHLPICRNTLPIEGKKQCRLLNTCMYCPLGARFTGSDLIDLLEQQLNFHLLLNTPAIALRGERKDTVSHLEVVHRENGQQATIHADRFVICAGALQTPSLLLRSKNSFWPSAAAPSLLAT